MNTGRGESENVVQVTIRDIEQAVDEAISRSGLSGKLTTSIVNGVYPDDTLKISALGSDENNGGDYYWAAIGFDEEDRSWLLGTTWYHHSNHSALDQDEDYVLYDDRGDDEIINDGFYWNNVSPDMLDEIGEDIISSVTTDLL
jgi:hypothetical protein